MNWHKASVKPKKDGVYLMCFQTADKDKPLFTIGWHDKSFGWTAFIPKCFDDSFSHWCEINRPKR